LADDPAAPLDMKHFCDTEGHQLAASDEVDGYFSFMIIKDAS
jgi:tRNA 2-thiouridine synthesizing protein A